MILNSKGKLFGKVSIVDCIITVLIVLAIIGAYIRFTNREEVVTKEESEIYYTVNVEEIRETNMEYLKKSIGTEFFYNGDENYTMGVLHDVVVTDATKNVVLNDGYVVNSKIPEKYDVLLTFKLNAYEEDDGYYTPQMREINIGRKYNVCNLYTSVFGTVEKIWK